MQPKKYELIYHIKKGLQGNENIEFVTEDFGTNVLDFKIVDEYGQSYDLTGVIPRLVVSTPITKSSVQKDAPVTSPTNGLCSITLMGDMYCEVGIHRAELQLWDEATNIIRLTLPSFIYKARQSLMNQETVEAENGFGLLQEMVEKVNNWDSQFEQKYNGLEQEYATQLASITTLTDTDNKKHKYKLQKSPQGIMQIYYEEVK